MDRHDRIPWPLPLALLLGLLCPPAAAQDECGKDEIIRMSEKGRTATGIAEMCDMDIDDVRAILDRARRKRPPVANGDPVDPDPPPDDRKPSGQPVMPCGCWGQAMPGAQIPNPSCRSGHAVATACPAFCPGGGYQWYAVCG